MIEKNKKGNLKKITLDNIDDDFDVETKIKKIIKRQKELETAVNFALRELQNGVGRINKF